MYKFTSYMWAELLSVVTNVLFDSLLCEILTQQEILFVGYYPTSYDVHF